MSSPQKQYTQELYQEFGYIATWLPGVPINLGDIGYFSKGQFERFTSLRKLKIPFRRIKGEGTGEYSYSSKGAVSEMFKARGEVPKVAGYLATAEAGFIVEWSRANATLFKANGITSSRIDDLETLGEQILELYRQGKWDPKYFVVVETQAAKSATILISSDTNAKIALSATGKIAPGGINIADIDAGLQPQFVSGLQTKIIASPGLTPLFKAFSVKKTVFGDAFFRGDKLSVAEITPDDLEYEE